MNGIKRGYFDGPAGQVHYRSGGAGGRPLILLHQSPLSSTQFDAVLPGLVAAGFHAAALDMPGFGLSDALPDTAVLDDFAGIVPAALDHFAWRDCAIVGHHTGAVIGALFAAADPGRVSKLVLNGFPLLTDAERRHFSGFYFGPKEPKPDGSHLLVAWQNRLRSTPGWTDLLSLIHI